MTTKRILGALGVLVVVGLVAGGVWYFAKKPVAVTPQAQQSPVLKGAVSPIGDYSYTENAPYYSVQASYPANIPVSSPEASAKAELTIEQALASDIAQFKADGNFANLTAEDVQIQGLGADRKYVYDAEYKEYKSANTVSYVFTIYVDSLGAHPNGYYRTFTFDMQGNELQLGDLFKPGSNYLSRLSQESYKRVVAELKKRTDGADPDEGMLETVRMGTAPSPEALQFFYVDGETLGLLFPPYQVAAYAAGSFEIKIPLSSLSDIRK